jgi:hypothetical protein
VILPLDRRPEGEALLSAEPLVVNRLRMNPAQEVLGRAATLPLLGVSPSSANKLAVGRIGASAALDCQNGAITAMIALAITHSVLAMPTAVITLSSENTTSSPARAVAGHSIIDQNEAELPFATDGKAPQVPENRPFTRG